MHVHDIRMWCNGSTKVTGMGADCKKNGHGRCTRGGTTMKTITREQGVITYNRPSSDSISNEVAN
jgi:hypothetical protein